MNLWTYWEGPRLPYLSVCLETMQLISSRKGLEFNLVTPETLSEFIPSDYLNPNYKNLKQPALKADCIRAALLAYYGGWWFDADTVMIRSPESIIKTYDDPEIAYCTWTKPPRRVLNGYIYFRKDNPLAKDWLETINNALEDPNSVSWCSIGEGILTKRVPGTHRAVEIPRRLFLPVDIDSRVSDFFNPGKVEEYVWEDTVCFGLNHSWFLYHHAGETQAKPQAWDNGDSLFFRLMRKAAMLVNHVA